MTPAPWSPETHLLCPCSGVFCGCTACVHADSASPRGLSHLAACIVVERGSSCLPISEGSPGFQREGWPHGKRSFRPKNTGGGQKVRLDNEPPVAGGSREGPLPPRTQVRFVPDRKQASPATAFQVGDNGPPFQDHKGSSEQELPVLFSSSGGGGKSFLPLGRSPPRPGREALIPLRLVAACFPRDDISPRAPTRGIWNLGTQTAAPSIYIARISDSVGDQIKHSDNYGQWEERSSNL